MLMRVASLPWYCKLLWRLAAVMAVHHHWYFKTPAYFFFSSSLKERLRIVFFGS